MPTVFIPNDNGQDFTAADEWGDLVPLSRGDIRTKSVDEHFRSFLSDMEISSPSDKVVVVGPSSVVALATAIMMHRYGFVNLLMYRGAVYHEVTLRMDAGDNIYRGEEDAEHSRS